MNRAGIPEQQGAVRTGETGEGEGFPGEQSAVRELPAGEPINVGTPGMRSSEPQEAQQAEREQLEESEPMPRQARPPPRRERD